MKIQSIFGDDILKLRDKNKKQQTHQSCSQSDQIMKISSLLQLAWLVLSPVRVLTTSAQVAEDCTVKFQDNDVCVCSMENSDGPVKCSNDSQVVNIEPCYCVYYDQFLNKTIIGRCFYTCYQKYYTTIEVADSIEFNEQFCNESSTRSGFFCYECKQPYAMAAYSYIAIDCVPCDYHGYKNWMKTFSIAILPLTLFYALAVLLSLNITSSSVAGIVLVLQCITSSPIRTYESIFTASENWKSSIFVRIFIGMIDIVNLSFFRFFYSPVCLHPKLNVFELACLDYIIALYPFLLIFATYVLITAHDRQYRLLVWLWKPFKACISRYRKTWNIRTSLLEIFASFILLSSVKIIQVSLDRMLSYTETYDPFGNKVKVVASISANITYFSFRHLPFALLAIAICSIFVLFPLLLLVLYPCRCFHKCLNTCRLRLPILHILMDAFQGSYKLHPRDMRHFSAFYLFLRVLMLFHAELFISPSTLYISGIISFAASGIVALFQPYKINAHNTADSILLLLMGIYFTSANQTHLMSTVKYVNNNWMVSSIIQTLSITLIVFYFICLLAWKLIHRKVLAAVKKWKGNPTNCKIESFVRNREDSKNLDESETNSSSPLLSNQKPTLTY